MSFFRKIRFFLKVENRKVFSFYIITFKLFFSLVVIALLPLVFFIIFIAKEPREVAPINDYVENKIKQLNINGVKFASAKITFNRRFEFVYIVSDFKFTMDTMIIKFPTVAFKIRAVDLIRGRLLLHEIAVNNFSGIFGHDSTKNKKKYSDGENLEFYDKIENIIYNTLNYFSNKQPIFNRFSINNSKIYVADGDKIEKIEVSESVVKIKKNIIGELKLYTDIKLIDKNKILTFNGLCSVNLLKDMRCSVKADKVFAPNVVKMLVKNTISEEYFTNINANFNIKIDSQFKNYNEHIKSSFSVSSKKGNFLLKQFFPNRIYFTNLYMFGTSVKTEKIKLEKISAKIGTGDGIGEINTDFSMSLDFKKDEFLNMRFDAINANIKDLKTMWPLNLGDEIREWVVEHFLDGKATKAFAQLDFDYEGNKLNLKKVDSEVNITDTTLNYAKGFPVINNMVGKLVFTENDMNIYVDSGNVENTKIKGKVYTNFTKPSIDITANSMGNVYELFYFINNDKKDVIEKTVKNYVNGVATSKARIDIPLYKNIDLDSVFIKIDTVVENNNTFLLNNNSRFSFNLLKDYDSSVFAINTNLLKSNIDFAMVDFIKKNNVPLNIKLDIEVVDENNIFLNNIIGSGEFVSFVGDGKIINGELNKLKINDVVYKDNNFNFDYSLINNIHNIVIDGSKINLNFNKTNNSEDLLYVDYGAKKTQKINIGEMFEKFVNLMTNVNINYFFNNILINKNYTFSEVGGSLIYDGIFNSLNIYSIGNKENIFNVAVIREDSNKKKYSFNTNIKNLGEFLSKINKTDLLIGGNLFIDGYINDRNDIYFDVRIKDKFGVVTKKMRDVKFFKNILISDLVSQKTKNKMINENAIIFDSLSTKLFYGDEEKIIKVNDFMIKSGTMFGVGIGGKGKFNVGTGKIEFGGVVIPADKINRLFGINKIPVLNSLIFGGKNGGLFTMGYSFNRENYNDNYDFKLIPLGSSSVNSAKNALLLLLLL